MKKYAGLIITLNIFVNVAINERNKMNKNRILRFIEDNITGKLHEINCLIQDLRDDCENRENHNSKLILEHLKMYLFPDGEDSKSARERVSILQVKVAELQEMIKKE